MRPGFIPTTLCFVYGIYFKPSEKAISLKSGVDEIGEGTVIRN